MASNLSNKIAKKEPSENCNTGLIDNLSCLELLEHTQKYSLSHTHTHAETYTHTHPYTHIHTHTHTHTYT